jgi:hypothetical protein
MREGGDRLQEGQNIENENEEPLLTGVQGRGISSSGKHAQQLTL